MDRDPDVSRRASKMGGVILEVVIKGAIGVASQNTQLKTSEFKGTILNIKGPNGLQPPSRSWGVLLEDHTC